MEDDYRLKELKKTISHKVEESRVAIETYFTQTVLPQQQAHTEKTVKERTLQMVEKDVDGALESFKGVMEKMIREEVKKGVKSNQSEADKGYISELEKLQQEIERKIEGVEGVQVKKMLEVESKVKTSIKENLSSTISEFIVSNIDGEWSKVLSERMRKDLRMELEDNIASKLKKGVERDVKLMLFDDDEY